MRVTPTTGQSPFEAAGVKPEQYGPIGLDLLLTDGQVTILRRLLETYAEESGQAPLWMHAEVIAEAEGVPLRELEALRSLFPDEVR